MKSRRASCNATAAPLRWSKWPSKRSRAAEKEIGDDAAFQNGFDRIQAELDQIVESCGMQSRKYLGGLSRRDGEVSGPVSAESTQSAQIAVLLERIDALDEQVAELERARIDAELERARIDAELERARIEAGLEHALLSEACAEAQQRLAHARHGLNDMKKSMSWNLMKPARSAARLLTRRSLRNNLKFPENHAHAS